MSFGALAVTVEEASVCSAGFMWSRPLPDSRGYLGGLYLDF